MTRAEFYDTHFKNREVLNVNLEASDFYSCKLKATRFFTSNLDFILVKDVKVWKSRGQRFFNFREGFRQISTKIQLELGE